MGKSDQSIEVALRTLVERVVREVLGAAQAGFEYRSPNVLPPGTSARTFREVCRTGRVQGARREGRQWVCGRDAWHAARASKPAKAPVANDVAEMSDEDLAERAIAGVRGRR